MPDGDQRDAPKAPKTPARQRSNVRGLFHLYYQRGPLTVMLHMSRTPRRRRIVLVVTLVTAAFGAYLTLA